jgi:heterodisulfide reductase subunit A
LNIELMTLTEVEGVAGVEGDFTVQLKQHPRFVDMDKCIACGQCAEKCPKKVQDYNYNEGLGFRKAIFVRYPQGVPLKYRIDPDNCIMLQKGKCGVCEKVCPAGAIKFDDKESTRTVKVGSLILAPGHQGFNPTGIRTWGFGVFPNVVTSLQLERLLASSGPSEGHLTRPSDGREAKKIAFLQCVGSRDVNKAGHGYCSSVCCMYAIKEALIASEHVPGLDVSIFFMDIRTHGKDFERYYNRAKDQGVKFHRCRVHSLEPGEGEGNIYLRYITDEGQQVSDEFDLVVLSVGLETPQSAIDLAHRAEVEINHHNFAEKSCFTPVNTSRPGIFACGTFSGPKNIPHSVMEASAAAAGAAESLSEARFTLTRAKEFPPERDLAGQEPRVGVFVCHCGSNIAGVIDVAKVADYAATLPHVAYVERNLFTCSQDTQDLIRQKIEEKGLNRIVVAACTPRTHEPLFRETLKASGLNEYLIEMANIRNQASWVHSGEPEAATEKAMDLTRMAVAKVALLAPLASQSVPVKRKALVVGGGVAGLTAALTLAGQGFPVDLVEKSSMIGGNAQHLFNTWKFEPIPQFVLALVKQVQQNPNIQVYLSSEVVAAEGFVGNFRSTLNTPAGEVVIEHGVTIMTTGGRAYKPDGYGYGQSRKVFTALEFDKLHEAGETRVKRAKDFVFIQCVGSREPARPYCSRVCCTHAIQAAIQLKQEDPERNVFILYRDIRTYGQREELYTKARELGVIFVNYDMHDKPKVNVHKDESVTVTVWDHVLHKPFTMPADVVILATAIIPNEVNKLAQIYKLPVDSDGFLQEAHVKLRPVDFSVDGMFLAGLAHYPKPIEETIAQAKAAASRAATVLCKESISLDSIKAEVSEARCDGCALCLDVCPFHAISLVEVEGGEGKRRIAINAAQCKGCGCCQATCPKDGVAVAGFTYDQLAAQVAAALS